MLIQINFIVDSCDSGFFSNTVSEDECGPLIKEKRYFVDFNRLLKRIFEQMIYSMKALINDF